MILSAIKSLFRKPPTVSEAAREMARRGAQMRRETKEARTARVHAELAAYVSSRKALITGEGFLS